MLNQDVWVMSPGNLLGSHNLCTLLDGTCVCGLVLVPGWTCDVPGGKVGAI